MHLGIGSVHVHVVLDRRTGVQEVREGVGCRCTAQALAQVEHSVAHFLVLGTVTVAAIAAIATGRGEQLEVGYETPGRYAANPSILLVDHVERS